MKSSHVPMRTCIGCRKVRPKQELVRIVDNPEGLRIDHTGRLSGRGVYICPEKDCITAAFKNNGIRRSLKKNIRKEDLDRLMEELGNNDQKD